MNASDRVLVANGRWWLSSPDDHWRTVAVAAQAALMDAQARISSLEAEVDSLSRQLRSRTINAAHASSGKRWRWSPLL